MTSNDSETSKVFFDASFSLAEQKRDHIVVACAALMLPLVLSITLSLSPPHSKVTSLVLGLLLIASAIFMMTLPSYLRDFIRNNRVKGWADSKQVFIENPITYGLYQDHHRAGFYNTSEFGKLFVHVNPKGGLHPDQWVNLKHQDGWEVNIMKKGQPHAKVHYFVSDMSLATGIPAFQKILHKEVPVPLYAESREALAELEHKKVDFFGRVKR